jgi:phosphoglycerate kinase
MTPFRTLDSLPDAQRVLLRLDLNSPVESGKVQDNRRFTRHSQTVAELASKDHQVIILAHQGRPGNEDCISLAQHADILESHLNHEVAFIDDTYGARVTDAIEKLEPGHILLLENTRMLDDELPEEDPTVKANTKFVQSLSAVVDCYVNDAYSTAHRSHASLVGFARTLPAYGGRVMQTEYDANTAIAGKEFDGQVTMVLGGTKAGDIIEMMEYLGETVDTFLLGGIAGELFLRASGAPVGYDIQTETDQCDTQWKNNHASIKTVLAEYGGQIELPTDLAYEMTGNRKEQAVAGINKKETFYLDIGTETAMRYADVIRDSTAVFVKGALGVFEDERFAVGTVSILEAIADTDCFSVVGGGDTSRAVGIYNLDADSFDHISIAGGAYLRALTGEPLIGVEVLKSG